MAGKKVNRHNPKNIENKRARKRGTAQKAAEELGAVTAAIGESVKPEKVEKPTTKPDFTVVDTSTTNTVPAPKATYEKGVEGAEGISVKGRHNRSEARARAKEAKKAKEMLPSQVEAQNQQMLSELPGAGTDVIPEDTIPAATLAEERKLRPTLKEDTRRPRPASFRPAPGKTATFTPLSQSQSESIPLTGTTDIESAAESRVRRAAKGMGIVGSEAGTEIVNHPVYGDVEVPKDLAEAHRLYAVDYAKDPAAANKKALGTKEAKKRGEEFLHPGEHAGRAGGYQTLARVRQLTADSNGSMPVTDEHIKKYARALGLKYTDALTGIHNSLMEEKRSGSAEPMAGKVNQNTGEKLVHPEDTWTHPETGEKIPVNGFHPDAQRFQVTDQNGELAFFRAKGSKTGMYSDASGKKHITDPVYIGWNRTGKVGEPGNWNFQGAPSVPQEISDAGGSVVVTPISKVLKSQLLSDKRMKLGSTESRKMISEAKNTEAAAATAPKETESSPYTSTKWEDKKKGRGRKPKKAQAQGILGPMQDPGTGQFGVDATGAGMPTPPKVGRRGNVPAYISTFKSPQLGKTDPLKTAAKFTQVSPASPLTTSFGGRTVTMPEVAEGPQPALGASTTPFSPTTESSKAEQMALPGFGVHSSQQFMGMPKVRQSVTSSEGGNVIPGTENTLREDPKVYKRGTAATENMVSKLQSEVTQDASPLPSDPTIRPERSGIVKSQMVQNLGKLAPVETSTASTFRDVRPSAVSADILNESSTRAENTPQHVGEPSNQPFLPFGDHKSGKQWLGAIKKSDETIVKSAREQDVVDATRARPVAASLGSVVPAATPSKTLAKIDAESGEAPEAVLPGAAKAAKRLATTEKPVKRGRAGKAKNEVSGVPFVGK